MSMTLLIQQNESLQKEFANLGYDASEKGLEQIKLLINNHFLNHKCKKVLTKIFKEHVENATGYIPAMYDGFDDVCSVFEPFEGQRFYTYSIDERNGEYEYTHKGVVALDDGTNADEWLEEYTSDFYGGGGDEEDGGYWFNGEIMCFAGGTQEISKDVFDVVKKYI